MCYFLQRENFMLVCRLPDWPCRPTVDPSPISFQRQKMTFLTTLKLKKKKKKVYRKNNASVLAQSLKIEYS